MADPVAEAGTTVDRFAMIDEASGHAPLYFGCVNDTAPWGIHGDQYVRLSDFSRLSTELTAERERNARLVAETIAECQAKLMAIADSEMKQAQIFYAALGSGGDKQSAEALLRHSEAFRDAAAGIAQESKP